MKFSISHFGFAGVGAHRSARPPFAERAINWVAGVLVALLVSAAWGSEPAPTATPAQPVALNLDLARWFPSNGIPDLVFAVRQVNYDGHWYANFGYYADDQQRKAYRALGKLTKLHLADGTLTELVNDPQGAVRDPQVHYDGQIILFSYRKGGTDNYHLYEIRTDGSGLRQITDGPFDDIEPVYLPDGDILFVSSRCRRWVNCWLTQVAVLYRCDSQGRNLRPISANLEQDNTPWPLPDGRVLYTRWEYVDRSQVDYHHLWTANPDGTGQMVYYGNLHPGTVMIDAKPIPGTDQVVALFSAGHGQREHAGAITIVSPLKGPDEPASVRRVSRGDDFRDPYPLPGGFFLAAQGIRIVLLDSRGNEQQVYRLPETVRAQGGWMHEPRPIQPRPREEILAPRADPKSRTGLVFLSDAHLGRNMTGVKPGEIRRLLVMESLPKPINYTGGMDPLSFGGTFTLPRLLGTVPVEPDGSAYFEVPALTSLFVIALDGDNQSVKRMQSFFSVMPGEAVGCVGCHEQRTRTPASGARLSLATRRSPSPITPLRGIPDVYDFPRDIQPILDKHCVRCHDSDRREGKLTLAGDHGPMFSHSYYSLTQRRQFVDGRDDPKSNLAPRSIGAAASPLMGKLRGGHYGVELDPHEVDLIRFWIEASAPYPGTYAALGSGMIGGYVENQQVGTGDDWPETKLASQAIDRRCVTCHQGERVLPRTLSDERDVSFWRPDFNDPRLRLSRHLVFNLTRPEKSLMALAPLAREAGGYGICQTADGANGKRPVFADQNDPDYRAIVAMCAAGQRALGRIKRFDMPGFKPPLAYVREMKRFGILPPDLDPARTTIDVYQTDRRYWEAVVGAHALE